MHQNRGISIIIPCYNDGRFLGEAIDSIYAQDFGDLPFEIVIVDDCSTDQETLDLLYELENHGGEISVFHNAKNSGLSATRNVALKYACYPYILPLDSDDKFSTNPELLKKGSYMTRSVEALEGNPDVVFSYCNVEVFGAVQCVRQPVPYDEKTLATNHVIGPFVVYRADEARAMGGYNETLRFGEDMDFNIALINRRIRNGQGTEVVNFEEPYVMYRRRRDHSNMTSCSMYSKRDMLAEIVDRSPEFYERHYPNLRGEGLLNRLMFARRMNLVNQARMLFTHCALHPLLAHQDGTLRYTAHSFERKVKPLWRRFRGAAILDIGFTRGTESEPITSPSHTIGREGGQSRLVVASHYASARTPRCVSAPRRNRDEDDGTTAATNNGFGESVPTPGGN